MSHLGEVHITERLEQHADEIQMRASMLHSHLESAAAALNRVKILSQQKAAHLSDNTEEVDDNAQGLLRKADDLISQIRSAKVVSSKSIRQLEDLRSRSLTLEQTALPAIEQTQSSTSDLSLLIRTIGQSVTDLLNEEGRTTPLTYSEIFATISSGNSPFSNLAAKVNATMAHVHTFYGITSSLTQTVEIPSPPPPPPWQLLAQKLHNEAVAVTTQEEEVVRLKDEVQERNTALAMRDRIVEELTVKVEILEKRVGESGGRRELVRELETAIQASRTKEKELLSKVAVLQKNIQSLEGERERWKNAPTAPTAAAANPVQNIGADTPPPASTLAQIQLLKSEISTLQSTIRYLQRQIHARHLDSSLAFLDGPLTPLQPPAQSLLQSEARDVLNEMLHLVTQPENQMVKLNVPERSERLKWRPVKETPAWQTNAMKEEWEAWRDWKNDVAQRATQKVKPYREAKAQKGANDVLARLQVTLPQMKGAVKAGSRAVRIVNPGEWESIQGIVGIEAS